MPESMPGSHPPPHADGATVAGERLLARIGRGEQEALAELYRLWGDRLFSMALHWLRDEGAAREALQDCLLRIWKRAKTFDPVKSAPFTWSAMLLRGVCLDLLRKRRVRADLWRDWEDHAPADAAAASGGIEDLYFRETVGRVRHALARLDAEEAESVRAALFDPGTLRDHAARWGVPLGTAKTRVHRAMTRLRELMTLPRESDDLP